MSDRGGRDESGLRQATRSLTAPGCGATVRLRHWHQDTQRAPNLRHRQRARRRKRGGGRAGRGEWGAGEERGEESGRKGWEGRGGEARRKEGSKRSAFCGLSVIVVAEYFVFACVCVFLFICLLQWFSIQSFQ